MEPVGLLRKFDEDCARLSAVRDTMVRSLSSQHLSALQRQAVAMGSLQRDLKILQADLETVKEGLGEQLSSITAASKPHWKFVPVQRAATSTERDAALALQQRWRRRPRHTHGLQYSTAAVVPWPLKPQQAVAVDSSSRVHLTSPKSELRSERVSRSSPR